METAWNLTEEVTVEVERLCQILSCNPDQLLRQLLRLDHRSKCLGPTVSTNSPRAASGLRTRDALLPIGLKLRAHYRGREYNAVIEVDGITVDGLDSKFTSPSLAGVAITNYAVNGWRFWEYYDETRSRWDSLNELRK